MLRLAGFNLWSMPEIALGAAQVVRVAQNGSLEGSKVDLWMYTEPNWEAEGNPGLFVYAFGGT
jgi:hypothetical protein